MFDSAARQGLEEMLGYERFVLAECGDAIRTERGKSGPVRLIINDSGPQMVAINISDTAGDIGARMVRKISPLVLTASFKLIDMILEWTIVENGIDCPVQFAKKISIIDTKSTIQFPDFLGSDIALRNSVLAIYKALTPYRNAVIHNHWVQAQEGTLDFDFYHKGVHFKKTVAFDEVLALSDSAELIGTMLVNKSADKYKLDSLRFLFNKTASLHGQPQFAISQPRYFQVIRRTVMPQNGHLTVDLKSIKAHVLQSSSGEPSTFDLTIVADASPRPVVWKIPFSDIPATEQMILDEPWNRLQVDVVE